MDEYRNAQEGSTEVGIDQIFDFGAHLFATRTSEAIQAVERSTRTQVLMWLLRFPLETNDETVSRFMRRLELIQGIDTSIPSFRLFGVESSGTAYLAMDWVDGVRLIEKSWDPREAQVCFVDAVRVVADLHRYKTLVGDICEDSFIIDEAGRVFLLAVLGTFEMEAKRTAALPSIQTLPFLSPEQRSGTGCDLTSDVYALGILGYRLFTGKYPTSEKGSKFLADDIVQNAPSPSSLRASLPAWVDDILARCLETSAEKRYHDAGALLAALEDAISGGKVPESDGRWAKSLIVRPVADGVIKSERSVARSAERTVVDRDKNESAVYEEESSSESAKTRVYDEPRSRPKPSSVNFEAETAPNRNKMYVGFGFVVALLVVIALVVLKVTPKPVALSEGAQRILYMAPDALQGAVNDLITAGIAKDQKARALQLIARSNDPAAYAVLSGVLLYISDEELRMQGLKAALARLEKSGLNNAATMIDSVSKYFLREKRDPLKDASVLLMLRASDSSAELKKRHADLLKLSERNAEIAIKFVAALALDTTSTGEFLPTLRDFLKRAGNQENLDGKSLGILLLANPKLVLAYEGKITPLLPEFSAAELEFAIRSLVETESALLYDVAREALRRGLVPPFQQTFLRALVGSDSFRGSRGLRRAIVDGSQGVITRESLEILGGWDDRELGRVLFAAMAIAADPRVSAAALEMLAMRGIAEEPGASLLNWARTSVWDYREKVAKSVGILANIDIAEPAEIDWAFDQLMPYTAKGSLLRAVLSGGDSRIISRTITRTAGITSSQELLSLLSPARDRAVRRAAVEALEGRNSLDVLHLIIKAYEKESDEEIRAVYREKHWVIRNREGKVGGAKE